MHRAFVIRGASVVDGTGRDPVVTDVRVADGIIDRMGVDVAAVVGDDTVDGSGLTLAPGFVDLHSHSDLYTLVPGKGGTPVGDAPKLLQGCTAQVFGQDGISAAPVRDDDLPDFRRFVAGLDGTIDPDRWTWRDFGGYLAAVRTASATRAVGLVGHATVRRFVMGTENRPPSAGELEEMRQVVADSLDQGAAGLSTGLVYVPAAYAGSDEVAALCEVAADRGKPFFVHVRSESERVVEATDEVIDIAARTGVHLHYSHIKTAGERNWPKAAAILERISAAQTGGVTVTADIHPYTAGSSTAMVLLPPPLLEGGVAVAVNRLGDPAVRERTRAQMLGDVESWDNWYDFSGGWEGLRIAAARSPGLAGSSFADVIRSRGVVDLESAEAFDIVFDMLAVEELGLTLISFNNVEENVSRFFAQPWCGVGSDGVVNPEGVPHPRLYGTFARILGRMVRQLGVVDLPEAVRRMTSHAAGIVGEAHRWGTLAPGRRADLVLFDPDSVVDRATYEEPRLHPAGVERVWVDGRPVVVAGELPP